MKGRDYEVACLLCSAEIGQIVRGKFSRNAGCTTPLPRKNGMPRCCHCGGSLYLEPILRYTPPPVQAELEKLLENTAA